MQIFHSLTEFPRLAKGCRVAIGKWDGVHVGHQQIIRELVVSARKHGEYSVVVSFDRHPHALFNPECEPLKLQAVTERSTFLRKLGVDIHLIIPFTKKFASLSPQQFVTEILVNILQANEVMVGYNFMFGKGKQGNTDTLNELCAQYGITTKIFSPISVDGEVVSSTKIRSCLEKGDLEKAKKLLGRNSINFQSYQKANFEKDNKVLPHLEHITI